MAAPVGVIREATELRNRFADAGHGGNTATGPGWAFEFKWDGVRLLAVISAGPRVRLITRNGRDVSTMFPELGVPGSLVGAGLVDECRMALDGEVVVPGAGNVPDIGLLQQRMSTSRPSVAPMAEVIASVRRQDLRSAAGSRRRLVPTHSLNERRIRWNLTI